MKAKILLVEDDGTVAALAKDCLEGFGYSVTYCKEAGLALEWLKNNKADLLITDINMPGVSGMKFCELLRQNEATAVLPIVMLTALKDEDHKVEGLKAGADDYLVKPFSPRELAARIEALLRRSHYRGRIGPNLSDKDIKVNLEHRTVSVKGKSLKLLPKEFDLLFLFLQKPGHVLTYQFIADSIWGYDNIATRQTIRVWVHHLRGKLGPLSARIQPVTGKGYKWE